MQIKNCMNCFCLICGKPFMRHIRPKGALGALHLGIRQSNQITCGTKCSKKLLHIQRVRKDAS